MRLLRQTRLHAASSAALLVAALVASCGGAPDLPAPPDIAPLRATLDAAALQQIERATAAVQSAPESAAAWSALGSAYETHRIPVNAEQTYGVAALLSPSDPKLQYRAAIAAGRAGETQRALDRLDDVLELAPDYGPAWRRRGTWLLDMGDAASAREAFERAHARLPDQPDAPLGLARAALLDDDVDAALSHAKVAHDRAPTAPYVRLILGTALRRAGRVDEALPHLEAGQGAVPRYVDPWSMSASQTRSGDEGLAQRAAQFEKDRDWPRAVAAYRELLQSRPSDTKLMLRLGTSLMGAGEREAARMHYDEAVKRNPGNYQLATARVSAVRTTLGLPEALVAIDAVIARWPDRAQAHSVRGDILGRMRNLSGAREAFQRATALDPSDFRGRMFEGRLLIAEQKPEEATLVLQGLFEVAGAKAPVEYFGLLLQAQVRSRATREDVQATVDRARALHGDAADVLTKKR